MNNTCNILNYQPIVITCVLSKAFNFCLNEVIESYFDVDKLQLGFAKEEVQKDNFCNENYL